MSLPLIFVLKFFSFSCPPSPPPPSYQAHNASNRISKHKVLCSMTKLLIDVGLIQDYYEAHNGAAVIEFINIHNKRSDLKGNIRNYFKRNRKWRKSWSKRNSESIPVWSFASKKLRGRRKKLRIAAKVQTLPIKSLLNKTLLTPGLSGSADKAPIQMAQVCIQLKNIIIEFFKLLFNDF